MGHTRPNDLKDVQDLLDKIRTLDGITEKSPNVFYVKSKPFLHFHDKDGNRWADVVDGKTLGPKLDLPFKPNSMRKNVFFEEVQDRYKRVQRK